MLSFKNQLRPGLRLAGKKITVMGLGLYEDGSGISATRFLVSRGAKVTVTDLKTRQQLAPQLKRMGALKNKVKLVLSEHREKDFKNVDLIVKNPGVPSTSKFLKIAKENQIPIETDISLFFQLVDKKRIIGITGTRGKSTTTTLIYNLIKTIDRKAVLGGNITKSPLAQMQQVKQNGKIVLELSSLMLESLEPHQISPHLAVFTNIYPDHLNTYASMKEYAAAKENIFKWQTPQDFVILNRDNSWTKKMGAKVIGQRFWFSKKYFSEENGCFLKNNWVYFRQNGQEQKVLNIKNIKLLGEHNWENILAAVGAAMILGIKIKNIKRVVENFRGVPNRLELLREIKGVKYYNDTTSTTPEATMAALRALGKNKNIILIAGGSDKGLDFQKLAVEIKRCCRTAILLQGTGTQRLAKEFSILNFQFSIVGSMADAVGAAKSLAKHGDIILLSPACASFGMFNNEFDRGEQFRKIVGKLK